MRTSGRRVLRHAAFIDGPAFGSSSQVGAIMSNAIKRNAIARKRRIAGYFALAMLAIGGSTLAVSAQGEMAVTAPELQAQSSAQVQQELRPAISETAKEQRQVRVIPLFNVPVEQPRAGLR
jgi:hypothetical protein